MTKIFLLDVAQPILDDTPTLLLLHVVITLLVEALILYFFRAGKLLQCLLYSLVLNLSTLAVGIIIVPQVIYFVKYTLHCHGLQREFALLSILYIPTVVIEFFLLKWMNRSFPVRRNLPAVLTMNLVTYIILFILLRLRH